MTPTSEPPLLVYCWPEMFLEQPGLGHMKEIARTLLIEASLSGRTALLPPLLANPQHNPALKGSLRWGDYFDWSELPVRDPRWMSRAGLGAFLRQHSHRLLLAGEPIHPSATEPLLVRFFPDSNIFSHWQELGNSHPPAELREPAFSNHYPNTIRRAAENVIAEIGPVKGVVHIRRGDLAGPETEPAAVSDYLRQKGALSDDRIFVLTNERDLAYLEKIRGDFHHLVFEHEVPCLQKILQRSGDNYLIFRIGKCIQANHDALALGTLRFMRRHSRPPDVNWLRRSIRKVLQTTRPPWTVTLEWLNMHHSTPPAI